MRTNLKKWLIIESLPLIIFGILIIFNFKEVNLLIENVEAMAQVVIEEPVLTDDSGESIAGDPNICMKAAEGERIYTKFCEISDCVKKTAKKGKLVNKINCLN